jgi:DNA-directed RNA polymerase subunit RPC12/RpoP
MTEESQLKLVQDVFAGIKEDKDGYCACPKCGSRDLEHDGVSIDEGYIRCMSCFYSLDYKGSPYDLLSAWNNLNRYSFQLKFIFNS